MQEISVPALVVVPDSATTTDSVVRRAEEHPSDVMLRRRTPTGWTDVTAAECHAEVLALAKGLSAAGIRPGDRVALLSATRYEWTVLDYAVWFVGAVTVPVYHTASADQVATIVRNSGVVAGFAEKAENAAILTAAGLAADRVWLIEDDGLAALTGTAGDVDDATVERARTTRRADDPATIVYTSGTTGAMKGCVLSHRNLLAMAGNTIAAIPEIFAQLGGSTLLFLPLAHSFARFVQVIAIEGGLALGHLSDPSEVMAEVRAFRPTFLPAVPRVLQKIFDTGVRIAVEEGKEGPFRQGVDVAVEYSRALSGDGPSVTLAAKHAMMDTLVYGRLREAVGGARFAVSGAAPLGERLAHFYRGIGITVLEGYGLTETTAPVAANLPGAVRPGTVGRPLAGCTLRVAEDGEIFARGPNVFSGYWEDEAATKEVLDAEGWLRTGDLGTLDDEGYLTIVGRKKDILVTASGKNVAPEPLEDRVRSHPLVSQCVVVGEGRPFVGALITLDADETRFWRAHNDAGNGDPTTDAAVLAELDRAVADANTTVSHAEAIKKFRILPGDLTEAGGHLTPSLKVRRAVVLHDFAADVDALYRS